MSESRELLKSIAARLSLAVSLLEQGDSKGASKALSRILRVLPEPDERNIAAALASLKE